ncbi:MAG: 50S ribosomal protein L11 [Candidatus Heimdallarchaeum endolithica]|uniref:Large ribosomal subunit protein uL11 n=1 Tax=Candidatus Heimdallarchaeum endolithica TaxID=2876572 RepID=A0A9Y1FN77_9ARCH|nr:MAG: 50S ribosomal protein L11 [Candidatus Heimdallarchaeum endolithica]
MSSDTVTVDLLVDGGKATPGGAMGPALGPTGVNIKQVVDEINKQTQAYKGMKVPVTVTVFKKTREFTLSVGIPPASALILKEAGLSKGSGTPNTEVVGNITFQQLINAAKAKWPDLTAATLGAACKELLGTMVCMGITCDGKAPRVVQKEIDEGLYADILSENEE